jgi:hypothetical protein
MSDWSQPLYDADAFISTSGPNSIVADMIRDTGSSFSGGVVWPLANLAMYVPVVLPFQATVYKMSFIVVTASGNYDIGIYDESGHRLVSKGSTVVPAAGIAVVDTADVTLGMGCYFLAMCIDNTTASIRQSGGLSSYHSRMCGLQEQSVGAVTLPNPATFATFSRGSVPLITAHFRSIV